VRQDLSYEIRRREAEYSPWEEHQISRNRAQLVKQMLQKEVSVPHYDVSY
jgi:hypothetical protein